MDRYAPSPDVARHLIGAFMPATSLKAGVARAVRSSGVQKDLVQANALMFCTPLPTDDELRTEVAAWLTDTLESEDE